MQLILGGPKSVIRRADPWDRLVGADVAGSSPREGVFLGRAIEARAPVQWSHAAMLKGEAAETVLGPTAERLAARLDRQTLTIILAEPITRRHLSADNPPEGPLVRAMVLSSPVDGQDEPFNDWYSGRHIHDVLKVPGYVSAQRFRVVQGPEGPVLPWRYLAIYEIAAATYETATAETARRSGGEQMPISPAAQRPLSAHYAPDP